MKKFLNKLFKKKSTNKDNDPLLDEIERDETEIFDLDDDDTSVNELPDAPQAKRSFFNRIITPIKNLKSKKISTDQLKNFNFKHFKSEQELPSMRSSQWYLFG